MELANVSQFLWIWNHYQGIKTPELHLHMAYWLSNNWIKGDRHLALLAFRSSGKSTIVGIFCSWLLYINPNIRIIVLSGDFSLAKKMVRNVRRLIERHPLTQDLRPMRMEQWASDQFIVQRSAELRDPSMIAKSISANITGMRSDIVICDDVEVPNTSDTQYKRELLRTRLQEIEFILVPGGLQLYVGTPHTYYSIYANDVRSEVNEVRPFLEGFKRLELPLIDTKGQSRWPERFTPEAIEAIRRRSGPAKFESQMLLQPRSITAGRLDPDDLRMYDAELKLIQGNGQCILTLHGRRLASASCWWDPAYGRPQAGDGCVIAALFVDVEGEYWLHRIKYASYEPELVKEVDEATQLCRQVAFFAKDLYLPSITLETNGLGRFLPGLLRRELRNCGVTASVIEKASTTSKVARIVNAFDVVLAARRLWVHSSVWKTPFITEMREWRPGAAGHDDGLDAVAGCLLSEPVRLPRAAPSSNLEADRASAWRSGQGTYVVGTEFEP